MIHPVVWGLTGLTFAFSLYALIDQTVLRRELSAQVFRIDENGTAYLNDGVSRVILSPNRPSPAELSTLPMGSTYVGATLRFGTGHRMDQDARGNLVLTVMVDGVQRRVATFSSRGAVGFGEIPLTLEQEQTNRMYLTGSADSKVRDGWQSTGSMDMVHVDGTSVGKLCNVYKLDDPTVTGIQIYSEGARNSITYSTEGQVFVGDVSREFTAQNTKATVLTQGSVVVEDSIPGSFNCLQLKGINTANYEYPLLAIYNVNTNTEFLKWSNGIQNNFFNEAYFEPDECYIIDLHAPHLRAFDDVLNQYVTVKTSDSTCQNGQTLAYLSFYADSSCESSIPVSLPLDEPKTMDEGTMQAILRCWLPSDGANVSSVRDVFTFTNPNSNY